MGSRWRGRGRGGAAWQQRGYFGLSGGTWDERGFKMELFSVFSPHSATPTPNFVSYNPTTGSMPGGPPLSPSRMQGNAVATSLALSQRGPPYLGGHQHGPPSRSRLVGMPMG